MKTVLRVFLLAIFACSGLHCAEKDQNENSPVAKTQGEKISETLPQVPTGAINPVSGGYAGKIMGTIRYEGALPIFTKINMAADPQCKVNSAGDVLPETIVVGENQALANVLVKITAGWESLVFTPPTDAKIIDQKGCVYYPHVVGVLEGQPVKFLNSDDTLHNVHIQAKVNAEKNEAMPKFRKESVQIFDKVESAFSVKCDVHPWMKAYIEVLAHPFFAVTAPDGKFEIPNLPAGHYQITAWHERLGEQVFELDVPENGSVSQDIVFKKPEGAAQLNGILLTDWR